MMPWPQIAMLVFIGMGVAINLSKWDKEDHARIIGALIGMVVEVTILYFGGFWRFT